MRQDNRKDGGRRSIGKRMDYGHYYHNSNQSRRKELKIFGNITKRIVILLRIPLVCQGLY